MCELLEYVLEGYNTGVKLRIQIIVFKQRIAMRSQSKKTTALWNFASVTALLNFKRFVHSFNKYILSCCQDLAVTLSFRDAGTTAQIPIV